MNAASRRSEALGFTLIELLVAITLLAVVSLLSWRGLDAVMQSRDRIAAASDELRALSLAFAQLDEDLRKSWAVRLLRPAQPPVRFTVSGEQARVQLELLRESGRPEASTQIQPVVWRLQAGTLERGGGGWRAPDGVAAQASLTWQPILPNIREILMQGHVQGQGWVEASALALASQPPLLTGLSIRVVREDGMILDRVFPIQD
jgi:general secretion pathway protein J